MTSVNTNYGALVALQNLNKTSSELNTVQNRINTGLKVSSARDNGAVFAMAEGQRTRVSALGAVSSGIDRANSVIDVGLSAGEAIGDILKQMKEKAVAGQATDLSTDQRAALQADFTALRTQINQIANSATFNGINLVASGGTNLSVITSDLQTSTQGRQVQSTTIAGVAPGLSGYVVGNGSVAAADDTVFNLNGVAIGTVDVTATMTVAQYLTAVSTATGGRVNATYNQNSGQFTYVAPEAVAGTNELSVTVAAGGTARSWLGQGVAAGAVSSAPLTATVNDLDFSVDGSGALATVTSSLNLDNATNASSASTALTTAIDTLNRQLATLGSQAKALDAQKTFLGKLSDSVEKGIGALVDADLAKESARLQALQVKQQLGAQALSIANSAPSIVMSFFR
jgi:flagellin